MKKVVLTIIGFAIAIGLVVGVIIPIATQGKTTGQEARDRYETVDTALDSLAEPVD